MDRHKNSKLQSFVTVARECRFISVFGRVYMIHLNESVYYKDVILPGDGPVEHGVDNGQNHKWNKCHNYKVG